MRSSYKIQSALYAAFALVFVFLIGLGSSDAAETVKNTKGLCLECHAKAKDILNKAVTHKPVRDGKCTACHNPHASKHSGLLPETGGRICFNCHDVSKGFSSRVVHSPVREGKCLACHDVHSSANAGLMKEAGAKACLSCHPDEGSKTKKYVHPEVKKGNCLTCHNPHSSANDGLLIKDRKALCASCHNGSGKAAGKRCVYETTGADCAACHSPHSSDSKGILKAVLHKPFEEKRCSVCHENGAGYKVKAGAGLCIDCHKTTMDSFNKINSHLTPGIDKNPCANCHAPHASDDKRLMKDKTPRVCYRCHADTREYVAKSAHTHPEIDRCSDCHESHGSNNRYFLSGGGNVCSSGKCHPTQGTFTHPVGDKVIDPRSKTAMDCATCHNPMGAPEEFHLRGEKDTGLCVLCHQV
ncbi:MAG: hypothetical protein HY886_05615 [Deltaproteobacteria bacterium]|nr:hypothetical protein [Deltaproteobacteria bacterium]